MRLRLMPREERFFDLFVKDMTNVTAAAEMLQRMMEHYDEREELARRLREAEHEGDQITHDIGRRLEETFVTPFDREDIHALISGLDDVLDLVEEVGDTFGLYGIAEPTPPARQQAGIVVEQCRQLTLALGQLQAFRDLERYWIEIHRLENEGDAIVRRAIANLFRDGQEPMEVIKWKDLYGLLEETIDACEDVANVIERIVVKHA
ncbi:MAG: DUF47 domain-containing protein [Candidatus Limnocylindria bacterium]